MEGLTRFAIEEYSAYDRVGQLLLTVQLRSL
jgi:hypothetical protein